MVTAIERFLDGDRDLARRRKLAQEHTERAQQRLEAGLPDTEARAVAMREAGQAVAFDPENEAAAELLSRLLLEPPAEIPPAVDERIEEDDAEHALLQARIGAKASTGWLLLVPILAWMGVRSWLAIAVFVVLMLITQGLSRWAVHTKKASLTILRPITIAVALTLVWSAFVFSPLVLTPVLTAMTVGMFILEPDRGDHRYYVFGGVAVIVVPLALELLGVVEPSLGFGTNTLIIHPRMADFAPLPTLLLLAGSAIASIIVIGRTITTATDALRKTRRRLALHVWHLDQLLPSAKRR
jgi:serine/threonine-protein kinase